VRTARLRALNVPVAGLVLIVGATVALAVGGNEIIAGRVGGSDLITFLFAMVLLGTNVAKVTKLNLLVQQAAAPCARIWEIIDTESTLTDAPDAVELTDVQGRITFRDVRFAYAPDSAPVLTDINLEIPPGEVVAIAGPSGAGKSTLANLVPRLYDVSSGAILVDGHDVRSVTRASLRHSLGIVPQETVLFATTIRENIAYGRPDATLEQITVAAEAAQAHEFISTLPQGYDTDIGEGGVKLSGGQRQRIAIARALLRDPRILILDEATSSLDAESESAVQAAIGKLLEGRTALIIAHRLSTIRNADRILVLDRGRIVEQGTHDELMAAGGLYRTLYETQLREETRAEKTEAAEA
jgi:subfamily B ATP-binding cassette protein MsbA